MIGKRIINRKMKRCDPRSIYLSGYRYDELKERIVRYSIGGMYMKRFLKRNDRKKIRSREKYLPSDSLNFMEYPVNGVIFDNGRYMDTNSLENKYYTCNGYNIL